MGSGRCLVISHHAPGQVREMLLLCHMAPPSSYGHHRKLLFRSKRRILQLTLGTVQEEGEVIRGAVPGQQKIYL